MTIARICTSIVLIFILLGCNDDSGLTVKNITVKLPRTIENLEGERLDLDIIGLWSGKSVDSLLLLRSQQYENSFLVYGSRDLKYYGRLFETGRGPGEFLNLAYQGQYSVTPDGIQLWVRDNLRKVVRNVDLSGSLIEQKAVYLSEHELRRNSLYNLYVIKDTCWICNYLDNNNMVFGWYNPVTETTTDIFKFYRGNINDVSMMSSNTFLKPDATKVAYAMMLLNQILITSLDGNDKFSISIGNPVNAEEVNSMMPHERPRYFGTLTADNEQIWVLIPPGSPLINGDKSHILVLDWQGNPLYMFNTGKTLSTIFRDTLNNNTLYAIDNNESLFKFDIGRYVNGG